MDREEIEALRAWWRWRKDRPPEVTDGPTFLWSRLPDETRQRWLAAVRCDDATEGGCSSVRRAGPVRVEGRKSGALVEPIPGEDESRFEAVAVIEAAIAWARRPGAGRALLVVEDPTGTAQSCVDAGLVLGPLVTASLGARAIRVVGPDVTGLDLAGDRFAAAFLGVGGLEPRIVREIRRRIEFGGELLAAHALPADDLWSDIEASASRVVGEQPSTVAPTRGPGPATRALLAQLAERLTTGVLAEVEEWSGVDMRRHDEFRGRVAARVAAILAGTA